MELGDKVVYQIYPKSFYDSNDDGIGDIKGITMKLEYLSGHGIDLIWLNPFFVSPQNDNGYDIADYYEIDKTFGTMKDVEELIAKASGYGIGLMFDMVLNHTSTEHEWFKKALSGDQYYKDFYFFKKVRAPIRQRIGSQSLVEAAGNMSKNLMNIISIYLTRPKQI